MSTAEILASRAVNAHLAWQRQIELERFVEVIGDRALHRVLEIGTWRGGMLWLFSQLADDDALLLGVDTGIQTWPWRVREGQRLALCERDSGAALDWVVEQLGGESLDLLHIDADHVYDSVIRDWSLYSPLVAPGGLVVLHDIAGEQGVRRFWSELDGAKTEIIDPTEAWGGIGILEV